MTGSRLAAAALLLTACAREPARRPAPPPYRAASLASAGRVDGRVVMPEGSDPSLAVLWFDDLRAGKPIPLARRYELDLEGGAFVPAVQATLAGGALLVRDDDEARVYARFLLTDAGDSLLGVVQESGAGQVVPTSRALAKAGLVRVTCDMHRSAQAWIRVFDQPYFAQADSAGRFAIDSVPAGTWLLRAWHPVLGDRDQFVTVDSAGTVLVDLEY